MAVKTLETRRRWGGVLKEGQEVEDQPDAGVVGYREEVVQAIVGVYSHHQPLFFHEDTRWADAVQPFFR